MCPYASCHDCCIVLCWSWSVMVVVVVEGCCRIPYQPTCADASPNPCTSCPDLCTLLPDRCTLSLWCYSSINQRTWWWSLSATCAGGVFLQPLVQTLLAPVVVSPVATCTGGLFLPPTGAHTPLVLEQLALCGGGSCRWMWRWYVYI